MTRKNEAITLSIAKREKSELEKLALEFGKTWGDKPNISQLIKAIARQELLIAPNHDWSSQRIETLEQARKLLLDYDLISEAEEIAKLLQERSELTLQFRQEIEKFLAKPKPQWRKNLENLIKREQPFRLTYQDAAERQWSFTVLHGELRLIEKHQYLVCTCEETEGNQDLPELEHNWTFRLDRIQDAVVNPVKFDWQPNLDFIEVNFKVLRGLAFAYAKEEPKKDDLIVGEIEGDPPQRLITRQVWSSFWFFREIAKYSDQCEIISPENLRNQFREKLKKLSKIYNLDDS
jgi:predicted DNA-binding transcriptional regulator YafY